MKHSMCCAPLQLMTKIWGTLQVLQWTSSAVDAVARAAASCAASAAAAACSRRSYPSLVVNEGSSSAQQLLYSHLRSSPPNSGAAPESPPTLTLRAIAPVTPWTEASVRCLSPLPPLQNVSWAVKVVTLTHLFLGTSQEGWPEHVTMLGPYFVVTSAAG